MESDPHDSTSLESEDPVTVSLGPMGYLFQQLRSAITWQYRRLKGVKSEIQILGEELEGLCTDLKDLSEAEDTITRCWVRQVRDLCYDTSDYLDELMNFIHYSSGTRPRTRLSRENHHGYKIFRVSRWPACNQFRLPFPKVRKLKRVHLIAKLSALAARVEDAHQRRIRFKLSPPQPSKHHHYAQSGGVSHLMRKLPLQLHVDNLIKLLTFNQDERNLKVVTIFGSAGAGKTAVARTLYHQYRGRFQYRAFLRVSRDPDVRRLLADMRSQIKAPPADAFSDVQGLIATITKHLLGKSYLIVTDDIWDTSTWDIISRTLPDGDNCRIVTTTQIEDVALACCSDQLKHIYEMTPLNGGQSGISEGGCTTYPSTEGMKEALNRVYNNLPAHLKTCLLYLNIYPEGWTIMKDELVKQWVAEGFICSVKGQDTEKTAGCYFDALTSTGMVQSVDTNQNDEVLSCTLHHMVLDFIRQKSMEENFVTIVNYFQTIIGLPDKVRRLSVQLGGAKGANNISGNMRIYQVRSLIFCGFFRIVPSIMQYGLLQVLILHIWSDQDSLLDLTTIAELYRLRYLKIECSITVKLPHKIRRLQQLGTLQVDARLYAVPSDIVYLEKLLHLHLQSESILPHGVGRMTCLRTLGSFDLGRNTEDNVRELGELENLQDLQLTCSTVQPTGCLEKNAQLLLGSVLKKLSMLQSVTLVPAAGSSTANTLQGGAGASSMIISRDGYSCAEFPAHLRRLELSRRCCIFCRLPKWLGELAQLCILKIAVGKLQEDDISILNGLPALASLSLHVGTASTENIVFGKDRFSALRYFKLTCTAPWLKFETGAMPNLEKLKLCFSVPIRIIIIERLLGLKEISAIIGCSGVDAGSAWRKAIINDPSNPEVQLMGTIYYGEQCREMVTTERKHGIQQELDEAMEEEADVVQYKGPEGREIMEDPDEIEEIQDEISGEDEINETADRRYTSPELAFLNDHTKNEIVDMPRKHTYADELRQELRHDHGGRAKPMPTWAREHLFEKAVTPSDVGKLNCLVVPMHAAERHFPPMVAGGGNDKGLLLNFEDGEGKVWRFRYSHWSSSQSYVLTKGWSRFVREKGLRAGDTVAFSCSSHGPEKQFFIDYRKSTTTADTANADENETGDVTVNQNRFHIIPQSKEGEATQIESLDNQLLSIEDLDTIKVTGIGSSGNMQLVRHKRTGQFIVLKEIQLNVQENIRKQILQEMKISLSTQCQFVVTCYQCFYVNGIISIALEYMDGGSLADFLKTVTTVPEAYLAAICKQVLKGLMYLHHERHIIHRDLKPSNILINHRGEVKISEFGVSAIIASSSAQQDSFTGTFSYMAPERITGKKHGYLSDIWSLGLVVLECSTGNFPYPPGDSFYELLEAVVDQPPPSAPSDKHSPEFCSFISECMQKNAEDRSSAKILLDHPFLSMYDGMDIDLADYFTTAGSPLATL